MDKIEVSLKEIFTYILYRGRVVLLSICLFSALFGGYGFIEESRINREHEVSMSAAKEKTKQNVLSIAKGKGESELTVDELTERKRVIEQFLDDDEKVVTNLSFQFEYNPLIVDPYKVSQTYLDYFEKIPLDSILDGLVPEWFDTSYVRSLITMSKVYVNTLPEKMEIHVYDAPGTDSIAIANRLFEYFVDNNDLISEKAGAHTLKEKTIEADTNIDSDVYFPDVIIAQREEVDYLNGLIGVLNPDFNVEEEIPIVSNSSNVLRNVGLGALVGLIIGMVGVACVYIYWIYIVTPEQIQRRFGIQLLGGIKRDHSDIFSKLSDRVAGNYLLLQTMHDASRYVAAYLGNVIDSDKTILLTGTTPIQDISEFAVELMKQDEMKSIQVQVGEDISLCSNTVKLLSNIDGVILVERLNDSTLGRVNRQLYLYEKMRKKVIGYVLI